MKKLVQKIKDTLNSIFSSSKGFTLLELLVVVLIIGILAGIALPQYKYSVMKTKYMRMADMARVIKDAQERYYLVNNQYAKQFSDLDIGFSLENIEDQSTGYELGNIDNITIKLSASQSALYWYKNDKEYMMYSLRLDNANIWQGARAMCAAYPESGENGKKICNSFPEAWNCVENVVRYSCRI